MEQLGLHRLQSRLVQEIFDPPENTCCNDPDVWVFVIGELQQVFVVRDPEKSARGVAFPARSGHSVEDLA